MSLKLMQKCNIIHADIKPDNILVTEDKSQVKLCDFGSAMYANEVQPTPLLVSRYYRAPEIMVGHVYDNGIDMWAIATTLFELATGKILFEERDNNSMLKAIQEVKGKVSNKFIRKGKAEIRDEHFDADNNFIFVEFDKQTRKPFFRQLKSINAQPEYLTAALRRVNKDPADLRKVMQFKDLLEKMLVLDSERRISPKEALLHPFITEK
jgi:serine/threonine-protein kinase PRP4